MKCFRFFCLILIFSFVCIYSQDNPLTSPPVTDAYGYSGQNGVLGGLGSAGSYVAVAHNTLLNPQVTGSAEAWVYLNSYNESHSYIVQKGSSFIFGIANASFGHKPFIYVNGTTFTANDSVPLNRWVHIGVSWFQGSPNSLVNFFLDGSPKGSQSLAATWVNNTDSLTIGGSRLSGVSGVNGYIDEVRLWSNTRGAADFARNRFVGIGDATSANSGGSLTSCEDYKFLIASWTFNLPGIAAEEINGFSGRYRGSSNSMPSNFQGQPIPYNNALFLPGNITSHVRVPHNNSFNLAGGGTIESWVYCNPPMGYTLISKGATLATTSFRVYIQGNGYLTLQIGSSSYFGGFVPLQKWTHIAVTWTGAGGGTFLSKFYINGQYITQGIITNTMPLTNDQVRIGNLQWDANNNFAGYIDELRIFSREMTLNEIRANMFNSTKSGTVIGPMVSSWDFDGDLNNYTALTGVNGTFNTGGTNTCRFSGYINELTPGAISDVFDAHPTTISRGGSPNPFPGGFSLKNPDKTVTAGNTIYDTIYIPGNVPVTNAEVFLSIQHENIQGIIAKLKAPNGVERTLITLNGGTGNSILTFLTDGAPLLQTFRAPWTNTANPYNSFINFGGANTQGNWILSVQDTPGQPDGRLLGWGLRLNNTLTAVQPVNNTVPGEFALSQNYPNPFNPVTNISFDLPSDNKVELKLFDVIGREIRTLVNSDLKAGSHSVEFDASELPSGVYFYTLTAGDFTDTKKMILIK